MPQEKKRNPGRIKVSGLSKGLHNSQDGYLKRTFRPFGEAGLNYRTELRNGDWLIRLSEKSQVRKVVSVGAKLQLDWHRRNEMTDAVDWSENTVLHNWEFLREFKNQL